MNGDLARRAPLFWLVLAVGLTVFELALGLCVQEDAFISFRYAQNLVEGHGLVYNPGERVEGITNFLWTVLLAGGMALGADPVPLARLAGMACSLGLLWTVWRLARRADAGRRVTGGLVAALVVASSAPVAGEAVQGLETVPFALLVTVGVALLADGVGGEAAGRPRATGRLAAGALVLAVAALLRPEGVGVMGLAGLGAAIWRRRRGLAPVSRGLLLAAAAFAVPYLVYWLWRLDYYGYPFPNTFYAKTGGGLHHLVRGAGYVGAFLLRHPALLLLSAWGLVAGWRREADGGRQVTETPAGAPLATMALVVIVGYLGYVCVVGGDFKRTFRFVVPVLGLWAVLVDGLVSRRWRALPGAGRLTPASALACILGLVALGALVSVPDAFVWAHRRAWDLERRRAVGLHLAEVAPPDAVLAIGSAGIVPYYSRLRTIDAWGLNDLHIAHRAMEDMGRTWPTGHEKHDWPYVFSRRPDIYVDEWYYVAGEPVPDLRERVAINREDWRVPPEYRARSAPLILDDGRGPRRYWFNWLERAPAEEPAPGVSAGSA